MPDNTTQPIEIELLAPAKDKHCGMEAIKHGADAVYIGATGHGARSAATNSIEDIEELVAFAHIYNCKVYVTVNTILFDNEIAETESMIRQLYRIGVDAIIVQDMGILKMDIPPIALHASTQTDNRTARKAQLLEQLGFSQIVLARELSLDTIADIHRHTHARLEAFVHGALCVSYSGQCYVSQYLFGRSANRGECSQVCRMAFTMKDCNGKIIAANKHLLSIKDLNRSEHLEEMIEAGITSFKIEGRLKDASYVKNVTAFYRQKLDAIIEKKRGYKRTSSGVTCIAFAPSPEKSFNRGFTDYFLHGEQSNKDIHSFHSPKSIGEKIGTVRWAGKNSLRVASNAPINNGDGLCFINKDGEMEGFRADKTNGENIETSATSLPQAGTTLFRNYNQAFEKQLSGQTADRKIAVSIILRENNFGFSFEITDEDQNQATIAIACEKSAAQTPQKENVRKQLGKLGGTPFQAVRISIDTSCDYFIPSSTLSQTRRMLVEKLLSARKMNYRFEYRQTSSPSIHLHRSTTYADNIANNLSRQIYEEIGCSDIRPAYELEPPAGATLMSCKHCIKRSMGWCAKNQGKPSPYEEPFFLETASRKQFKLEFDCAKCEMRLLAPPSDTCQKHASEHI